MGFKERVSKFFSNITGVNSMEEKEYIEFREGRIDLIKGEISDLIYRIDENNSVYKEMLSSTDSQIEKGFDRGSTVRDHITQRHTKKQRELVKSLGEKKAALRREEEILEDLLEKGSPAINYADSVVRGEDGAILMLLRNYHDTFHPGKWGLPGGKIEQGESARDGAIRELKEETNLTAIEAYPSGVKKLPDGGTISFFSVNVVEDQGWVGLDDEEHCNYCFMSIDEIRRRPETDFILDAKKTILDLIDPFSEHMRVLEKAYDQGQIDYLTLEKANNKYTKTFKFLESTIKD